MAHDGGELATAGALSVVPSRRFALAFVAFALLFGQPVVAVALSLSTPGAATLAVIAGGTAALAGSAAAVFVRQRRSIDRLGDFVVVLALTQIAILLASRAAWDLLGSAAPATVQPLVVLLGYPLAYVFVYRGHSASLADAFARR